MDPKFADRIARCICVAKRGGKDKAQAVVNRVMGYAARDSEDYQQVLARVTHWSGRGDLKNT
jgi:hypothetical protein